MAFGTILELDGLRNNLEEEMEVEKVKQLVVDIKVHTPEPVERFQGASKEVKALCRQDFQKEVSEQTGSIPLCL